jgi:hypothetical protein
MGSILAKLKPSGKSVKKVATDSVTVVTLLASLSTFTGVTARSFIPGTAPPAPHSVVHAGGREIPLPAPPRKNEIILHLPAGSQIKETTHLRNGKSVEWEFKVGPGGADVSGNWGQ